MLCCNSLGAETQIQAPVLPHNPVAVGAFFVPVLVPELATFPFPNLDFQQHLRLAKILMSVNSLCSSNNSALLAKISSQLSSSMFISP